ncbi:hypothetical protein [Pseudorhodoferax sp. Leaf274]|uniref:hypothetical protein n=1 Tax=Pseudorhodoferax sp. Leaf274 TaxID=1736318 RepID=UPI0007034C5A|nr:hypothetical protein [Pseudorhodoferax sp. Leaf274]KQP49086.1 hypothetical protein ASF44_00135 [Pseudorhodoferax sp. Leaf274]
MARLRHIAVHVEEPKPGRFAWVLSERGVHDWEELDRSAALSERYQQAMAEGLLALQAMVPDLDIGPRSVDELALASMHDDARPAEKQVDHAAKGQKRGGRAAPAAGKSYFGFGPAR